MSTANTTRVVDATPAALAIHREINDTVAPYPRDVTVPDRFEYWAARRPGAPAVIQGDRMVCYGELNRLANGFAAVLHAAGVTPGATVGVCVPRSPEMLVALVGVLKAGATYVPLDPEWPDDRLGAVVADADCRWLATDRPDELAARVGGERVMLRADRDSLAEEVPNPSRSTGPDDIACVNFTSGSTGRPKGVPIRHRGINRLVHGATYGPLDEHSRVLQITPVTFDIATWEIWGALLRGGVSVLYPAEFVRLSRLTQVIRAGRVSILLLTTALFNSVIDEAPEALDTVGTITSGGEAHSPRHMAAAVRRYGPGRVVNLYGPTECTCIATHYPMDDPPTADVPLPIGKPIQNTRVYLLGGEHADRLCEPGEPGEICLAGDGLAAGYLHRPELTAQRFVHRDIGGDVERLYRTGDLGHLLPSGDIVFNGRTDDQVKVNSFRIELGEITHHLNYHPMVKQSCVAVQDNNGNKSIVAFVVPVERDAEQDVLRKHLATKLPKYMVPRRIHFCNGFPLTPNGKVDRRALLTAHEPSAE